MDPQKMDLSTYFRYPGQDWVWGEIGWGVGVWGYMCEGGGEGGQGNLYTSYRPCSD